MTSSESTLKFYKEVKKVPVQLFWAKPSVPLLMEQDLYRAVFRSDFTAKNIWTTVIVIYMVEWMHG